jgi:hypothetical protein
MPKIPRSHLKFTEQPIQIEKCIECISTIAVSGPGSLDEKRGKTMLSFFFLAKGGIFSHNFCLMNPALIAFAL